MSDVKEKSAAEIEREKIAVVSTPKKDEEGNIVEEKEGKEVGGKEEIQKIEKEEIEEENDDGGEVENKEKEIEDNKKKEEELEAEKKAAGTAAEKAKIQKRIDKEVGKRKTLEDELEKANRTIAELKAGTDGKLTVAEAEDLANKKADEKDAQREFVRACNRVADSAEKIDKDFNKKVDIMAKEIGQIPSVMIGILDDIDNGGEVLAHLVNNVDEAEDYYDLQNKPIKLGVKLAQLGTKLAEERKQKEAEEGKRKNPKTPSKVPDPIDTISGNNRNTSTEITQADDKLSAEDWIKKREKQVASRRAAR